MCPSGRQYFFLPEHRAKNHHPFCFNQNHSSRQGEWLGLKHILSQCFFNPPGRGLLRGVLSVVALLYSFSLITLPLWWLRVSLCFDGAAWNLHQQHADFFNGRLDMQSPNKYFLLLVPTVEDAWCSRWYHIKRFVWHKRECGWRLNAIRR